MTQSIMLQLQLPSLTCPMNSEIGRVYQYCPRTLRAHNLKNRILVTTDCLAGSICNVQECQRPDFRRHPSLIASGPSNSSKQLQSSAALPHWDHQRPCQPYPDKLRGHRSLHRPAKARRRKGHAKMRKNLQRPRLRPDSQRWKR